MTENAQLADLRKLQHFSPKFDSFFEIVRDTVQHNIERGTTEPTRYALTMHFNAVEEDVYEMPKIVRGDPLGNEGDVMCLADTSDCFGRIVDGGVFPRNIPDWMSISVWHNEQSDEFSFQCTFFVPPLEKSPNDQEPRICGHTKEEHKSLAIASYAERSSLMEAALSGDLDGYKRHLMTALRQYGERLSS